MVLLLLLRRVVLGHVWSVQKHKYLPGFRHIAERAARRAVLQKPCVLPRFRARQRPKIDQKTAFLEPSRGLG